MGVMVKNKVALFYGPRCISNNCHVGENYSFAIVPMSHFAKMHSILTDLWLLIDFFKWRPPPSWILFLLNIMEQRHAGRQT